MECREGNESSCLVMWEFMEGGRILGTGRVAREGWLMDV